MSNKQKQAIKNLCPWYKQGECIANPGVKDKCDLTCEYGDSSLYLLENGFQYVEEDSIVLTKADYDRLCHLAYFGYDDAYEKGSQETAKDILSGLECFFWETAINDTKYFDLYQSLYRSIKEHIKNKYSVGTEEQHYEIH